MAISTDNPAVEYLTTSRIGQKGQLTVPKEFREDLGLEAGAPFVVLRMGDVLLLLPEKQRFERLCQRISSALTRGGAGPEDLIATLPEARGRVFARRYGAPDAASPPKRQRPGARSRK